TPEKGPRPDVTGDGLPAPATPAAAERPAFSAKAAKPAVQNRSIGTLAGRAQARYRPPSVQCTKSAQSVVLFIQSGKTLSDADLAFPARHSPEHRHHSAALRVPGCDSPYHRAGGLCGLGPGVPPCGHGLSRSGQPDPARLLGKIRTMAARGALSARAVHHQG